jgi:hypothetical protein
MPVAKLPLREALNHLANLGQATVVVQSGAASARLSGKLAFEEVGPEVQILVGCACRVLLQRDRLRHVVFGEKDLGSGLEGHAQLFDGNYDRVVAFAFPQGLEGVRALARTLDGNDFEILP